MLQVNAHYRLRNDIQLYGNNPAISPESIAQRNHTEQIGESIHTPI
jgi:hypothetical protein